MRIPGYRRAIARLFVVLCLLVVITPSGLVLAQTSPATPVMGDESSATPTATTEVSTEEPPATLAPTTEPTETQETVTPTPGQTEEPSTSVEAESQGPIMPQAAPSTGAKLTVDGLSGTILVSPGDTQSFAIGDLLDMAALGPEYISSTNPDPDFYRFNGWWTDNEFLVYPGRGCQGQFIADLYTGRMQPESASASSTYSGATGTYSVQSQQWLSVWWIEKSIDIVDTVDEVTVYPYSAKSNCVNVEMSDDQASLLANGMTGSVTVNEGDPIVLLSNKPSGDTWTQSIFESTEACSGDLANLVSGGPGSLVGTNLMRKPGTYWFGLRSTNGSELRYGNCVQVTVQDVPATLRVEGSSGPVDFLPDQTLSLYVNGFTPGASLIGLVSSNSTNCSDSGTFLTSGTADSTGALEIPTQISYLADISIRFVSVASNGAELESTNCVHLRYLESGIHLQVNDSIASPVLVDGGEIHLFAWGLPPGSVAFATVGCDDSFDPGNDFGQVIGDDGVFDGYMSDDLPTDDVFEVQVLLGPGPDYTVRSNCVMVRLVDYLIDPVIAINGSDTPAPVVSGEHFSLTGIDFPPDADIIIRAFPGSSDCTGTANIGGTESDAEGIITTDQVAGDAGMISFQAQGYSWISNCVPLQITAAPTTPTPTPIVVVPTGPITLYANGKTDPQTLAGGANAKFTAANLGEGETYRLDWYQGENCTGTSQLLGNGIAGIGQVGSLTRYVASTASFRLVAGERTSNCVQVSWLAIPPTATVTTTPTTPTATTTTTPTVTATVTATATSTSTATVVPTSSATVTTTPTATDPVGTATSTRPVTIEPTNTATGSVTPDSSSEVVTGLPSTGNSPKDGMNAALVIQLTAVSALIVGMVPVIAKRAKRR
ncbi:MAG: hypothetical protein KC435_12570 [Thermomicrobiales bacterium]|nr:hypothetical protein [Thermomicrobiales bacterium]